MVLNNEENADRMRKERAKAREIGPIPPVVDPIRRGKAFDSLRFFCETYLSKIFRKPWSPGHLRAIERFESTIKNGGLYALAMPRGQGKTALARAAVLWAVLTGRRSYVLLICATSKLAKRSLKAFKSSLQGNKLLLEDFPEACFPVKKLGRMPQRAKGQLCNDEPTDLQWTDEFIQLANIPGAPCAGRIIDVVGITGAIRGRNIELASGEQVRPDYLVPDDVQTKKSAKNPRIVEEIIETIQADALGLAGPDVKIAGCGLFTVIYPDDAADQLLNRDLYPAWYGERISMLESMPKAMDDLWKEYQELLYKDLRSGDESHRSATAYYLLNRDPMDAGALPSWDDRFVENEVSAIQHAMNLLFTRGEATFWSEYQNRPRRDKSQENQLTSDLILSRCSGVPRGIIPSELDKLTAFVDVQDDVLFWLVASWNSTSFAGSVVDYGVYPEQPSTFFSNAQGAKLSLQRKLKVETREEAWYKGLEELQTQLSQPLMRDGNELRIDRVFVDASDGDSTDVIYRFCRAKGSSVWMPSHGRFVGETGTAFNDLPRKPGETIGHNWKFPLINQKRFTRHVTYDTNYWKSFVASRLKLPLGSKSSFTLFGARPDEHRMFADHCTAEAFTRKIGPSRAADIWKLKPGRTENHWFDCFVGSAVAASSVGCQVLDAGKVGIQPTKKRNLAEEQAEARRKRNG